MDRGEVEFGKSGEGKSSYVEPGDVLGASADGCGTSYSQVGKRVEIERKEYGIHHP